MGGLEPCREESDVATRPTASLELQPSEGRVFEAASRFFAALLGAGRVNETNQPGIMRYCIRAAVQLALETDRTVQAEQEPTGQGKRDDDLDLELELDALAESDGTSYRSGAAQAAPARGR